MGPEGPRSPMGLYLWEPYGASGAPMGRFGMAPGATWAPGPFWGGIGMATGATWHLGPWGVNGVAAEVQGPVGPVDRAQGPGPVDRAQWARDQWTRTSGPGP